MSLETLILLRYLLTTQQINVGADDFLETVPKVVRAMQELDQAIEAATKEEL